LIDDYKALVPTLQDPGFAAVAFSYPQRTALGSTTLAWSSESQLVNYTNAELIEAFNAVNGLRDLFPVNNPTASIADIERQR